MSNWLICHHSILTLTGFTVNTPYGHYVITDDDVTPVIKRMKPAGDNDDGNDLTRGEGLQGDGVPYEPLLTMENINRLGVRLQRNSGVWKITARCWHSIKCTGQLCSENFPTVENINDRIIGLQLPDSEAQRMMNAIANPNPNQKYYRFQVSDKYFRLVDVQMIFFRIIRRISMFHCMILQELYRFLPIALRLIM